MAPGWIDEFSWIPRNKILPTPFLGKEYNMGILPRHQHFENPTPFRRIHPLDLFFEAQTRMMMRETATVMISRFYIMAHEIGEMISDCDKELKFGGQPAKPFK
jgi:hypothetical protein